MPEFDLHLFADDALRLALAVVLGGIIGAERQVAGQSAGLRTHVLVALGAAVFVLGGITGTDDPNVTRVVQGVAAGVGFIGAGAILRTNTGDKVRGVTTAGSIWVAAAMGTSAGLGEYALASASGLITVVVLLALRPLSVRLSRLGDRSENPHD
jgi:putative Mg2+ transporter-C (MgtC) family protein